MQREELEEPEEHATKRKREQPEEGAEPQEQEKYTEGVEQQEVTRKKRNRTTPRDEHKELLQLQSKELFLLIRERLGLDNGTLARKLSVTDAYIKKLVTGERLLSGPRKELAKQLFDAGMLTEVNHDAFVAALAKGRYLNARDLMAPPATLEPPPRLVGYEGALEMIEARLRVPSALVAIGGGVGMGKSAMARTVAWRYRSRAPDDIIVIQEVGRLADIALMRVVLQRLGVPSKVALLSSLKEYCQKTLASMRALVIVENASTIEPLQSLRTVLPRSIAILVTTRNAALAAQIPEAVTLYGLQPTMAWPLIARHAGRAAPDQHVCERLAVACRGIPRGLELVGRLLAARPIDVQQLVERLETSGLADIHTVEAKQLWDEIRRGLSPDAIHTAAKLAAAGVELHADELSDLLGTSDDKGLRDLENAYAIVRTSAGLRLQPLVAAMARTCGELDPQEQRTFRLRAAWVLMQRAKQICSQQDEFSARLVLAESRNDIVMLQRWLCVEAADDGGELAVAYTELLVWLGSRHVSPSLQEEALAAGRATALRRDDRPAACRLDLLRLALRIAQGDLEGARDLTIPADGGADPVQSDYLRAQFDLAQAQVALAASDAADRVTHLAEQAFVSAWRVDAPDLKAMAALIQGELALTAGKWDEAHEWYEMVAGLAASLPVLHAAALRGRAVVEVARGAPGVASETIGASITLAMQAGDMGGVAAGHTLLARLGVTPPTFRAAQPFAPSAV